MTTAAMTTAAMTAYTYGGLKSLRRNGIVVVKLAAGLVIAVEIVTRVEFVIGVVIVTRVEFVTGIEIVVRTGSSVVVVSSNV